MDCDLEIVEASESVMQFLFCGNMYFLCLVSLLDKFSKQKYFAW